MCCQGGGGAMHRLLCTPPPAYTHRQCTLFTLGPAMQAREFKLGGHGL